MLKIVALRNKLLLIVSTWTFALFIVVCNGQLFTGGGSWIAKSREYITNRILHPFVKTTVKANPSLLVNFRGGEIENYTPNNDELDYYIENLLSHLDDDDIEEDNNNAAYLGTPTAAPTARNLDQLIRQQQREASREATTATVVAQMASLSSSAGTDDEFDENYQHHPEEEDAEQNQALDDYIESLIGTVRRTPGIQESESLLLELQDAYRQRQQVDDYIDKIIATVDDPDNMGGTTSSSDLKFSEQGFLTRMEQAIAAGPSASTTSDDASPQDDYNQALKYQEQVDDYIERLIANLLKTPGVEEVVDRLIADTTENGEMTESEAMYSEEARQAMLDDITSESEMLLPEEEEDTEALLDLDLSLDTQEEATLQELLSELQEEEEKQAIFDGDEAAAAAEQAQVQQEDVDGETLQARLEQQLQEEEGVEGQEEDKQQSLAVDAPLVEQQLETNTGEDDKEAAQIETVVASVDAIATVELVSDKKEVPSQSEAKLPSSVEISFHEEAIQSILDGVQSQETEMIPESISESLGDPTGTEEPANEPVDESDLATASEPVINESIGDSIVDPVVALKGDEAEEVDLSVEASVEVDENVAPAKDEPILQQDKLEDDVHISVEATVEETLQDQDVPLTKETVDFEETVVPAVESQESVPESMKDKTEEQMQLEALKQEDDHALEEMESVVKMEDSADVQEISVSVESLTNSEEFFRLDDEIPDQEVEIKEAVGESWARDGDVKEEEEEEPTDEELDEYIENLLSSDIDDEEETMKAPQADEKVVQSLHGKDGHDVEVDKLNATKASVEVDASTLKGVVDSPIIEVAVETVPEPKEKVDDISVSYHQYPVEAATSETANAEQQAEIALPEYSSLDDDAEARFENFLGTFGADEDDFEEEYVEREKSEEDQELDEYIDYLVSTVDDTDMDDEFFQQAENLKGSTVHSFVAEGGLPGTVVESAKALTKSKKKKSIKKEKNNNMKKKKKKSKSKKKKKQQEKEMLREEADGVAVPSVADTPTEHESQLVHSVEEETVADKGISPKLAKENKKVSVSPDSKVLESPSPPPPPNAIIRFLLGQGPIGHALAVALVLFVEWIQVYLPQLAESMAWAWQKVAPESLKRRLAPPPGRARPGDVSKSASVKTQYSGRMPIKGKQRKALSKIADKEALNQLRRIGDIRQAKYRHVSVDFLRLHRLGPFHQRTETVLSDINTVATTATATLNQAIQDQAMVVEEDDESDTDWVWKGLTSKKPRTSLAFGLGKNRASVSVDFEFGEVDKKREQQTSLLEAVLTKESGDNKKRKRRKSSGPQSSDREGGSGVAGRIRAVAGANSLMTRSLLGAYPGDLVPPSEAADAAGVIDLARKYGYGDWSDADEETEEEMYNYSDEEQSSGVDTKKQTTAGKKRKRRKKSRIKKRDNVGSSSLSAEASKQVSKQRKKKKRSSGSSISNEDDVDKNLLDALSSFPSDNTINKDGTTKHRERQPSRSRSRQRRRRTSSSTRPKIPLENSSILSTNNKKKRSTGASTQIRPAMERLNSVRAKKKNAATSDDE